MWWKTTWIRVMVVLVSMVKSLRPEQALFPKIVRPPYISAVVDSGRVGLQCEFKSPSTEPSSLFEVTWLREISPQLVATRVIQGGTHVSTLRNTNKIGEAPLFRLGNKFACSIRAWYARSRNITSPTLTSDYLFVGFKVTANGQLRISESGKPLYLDVEVTAPIVCNVEQNCSLSFELLQTSTQAFVDTCDVTFWPSKEIQRKSLGVVSKRDFIDDGNQSVILKFRLLNHTDLIDWHNHEKIPDIQLVVEDVATERCTSSGESHMITFDGLMYNHYAVGDYILVRSKCREFEVHIRMWKCASASCNCGIAAREGDDIVVMDMCHDGVPRAWFANNVEPHDATVLQRSNDGKSFIISFPSGAFVRFDVHHWSERKYFANVIVQATSEDYKCVGGLCGTFDKNTKNDLKSREEVVYRGLGRGNIAPRAFTESWRLTPGDSLFYHRAYGKHCKPRQTKRYCYCQELLSRQRQVSCDYQSYSVRPRYDWSLKNWKELYFPMDDECPKIYPKIQRNGIILPDDADKIGFYYYDPPLINTTVHGWPTLSGKTEEWSKQYCKTALSDSKPGMVCQTKEGFEMDRYVLQCIEDIQMTDAANFTSSAVLTMQAACAEYALRNMSFWSRNMRKNITEPPQDIGNTLCPHLCSNQGKCINASCLCNEGYVSTDCSLVDGSVAILESIPIISVCDIRKRNCRRIRLMGSNLLDSAKMMCRAKAVKISEIHRVKSGELRLYKAQMLSFKEAMCDFTDLPLKTGGNPVLEEGIPAGGYLVDITNDGAVYSKEKLLFIFYDGKCMICDGKKEGTCAIKPTSCLVNGYCYTNHEKSPKDPCFICDSSKSTIKFSKDTSVSAPVFNMSGSFEAFKKQEFKIQLSAYDPNGKDLEYQLWEEYEGVSLSGDGVFKWTPSDRQSRAFKVKATSTCGIQSSFQFAVEVLNCSICSQGEICYVQRLKGSGNGTSYADRIICICPEGCTGKMCQEDFQGQKCVNPLMDKTVAEDSKKTVTAVFSALGGVVVFCVVAVMILLALKHRQRVNRARGMAKPGPIRNAQVVESVYDDEEDEQFNNFSYSLEKLQKS